MARTAAFERTTVVRAARTVFWQHGYEEAALPLLEKATGLSRSSIYNAFGSKRGLFDAAVQSYLDDVIRPRIAPLLPQNVGPASLVTYLRDLHGLISTTPPPTAGSGCLLINAAGAPIANEPEVAQTITAYRAELTGAILRGVTAAFPQESERAREQLSQTISALVISALALARVDMMSAAGNISLALDLLDQFSAPSPDSQAGLA